MNQHRSMKLHYYLRGGILFGLTSYVLYLVQVDKLHYYIVPRMAPYMKLSVIALYLLALYCIYLAWQEKSKQTDADGHQHTHEHDEHCGCQHEVPRSKTKSMLLYSIFIVPLLLGFAMPDRIMGSDIVAVKGMNLSASNGEILQQAKVTTESESLNDVQISQAAENSEASMNDRKGSNATKAVDNSGFNTANVEDSMGSDTANSDDSMNSNLAAGVEAGTEADAGNNSEAVKEPATEASDAAADAEAMNELQMSNESVAASNQIELSADNDQSFDALFPSDQYSVELAELGKQLYQKESITIKEEGFLETLTTLDLYRDNFIGKTIRISGFVYREDDMSQDTFVVSRMAMQCCSADASPYGFLVQWDNANTLEKDKWIEVVGTFGLTEYNDIDIVQLKATNITAIEAPNDPYVYPYFDDFVKIAEE